MRDPLFKNSFSCHRLNSFFFNGYTSRARKVENQSHPVQIQTVGRGDGFIDFSLNSGQEDVSELLALNLGEIPEVFPIASIN